MPFGLSEGGEKGRERPSTRSVLVRAGPPLGLSLTGGYFLPSEVRYEALPAGHAPGSGSEGTKYPPVSPSTLGEGGRGVCDALARPSPDALHVSMQHPDQWMKPPESANETLNPKCSRIITTVMRQFVRKNSTLLSRRQLSQHCCGNNDCRSNQATCHRSHGGRT